METWLEILAIFVAQGCEAASVLILAFGALAAMGRLLWPWRGWPDGPRLKEVWLGFASGMLLALEFALAADIARTAVEPSWDELGQLAAIAAIRTILNLFLERDLEAARKGGERARSGPDHAAEADVRGA